MTLEDFKRIFLWEWSHRILGRFIGVFFVLPALYFSMRRGMTTSATRWKLLAIGAGIGFQGFLGWFMVASGLKNPYENEGKSDRPDWYPRVDHFRLAAHLGAAFLVYMGMLYSAVGILRDAGLVRSMRSSGGADQTSALTTLLTQLQNPKTRAFRRTTLGMLGLVFTTAIYGAFVAGLDAGLLYNEFPTMGGPDRLLPPKDELIDPRYRFRGDAPQQDPSCHQVVLGNLLQNPVTVQAVHRGLGISTLLSMIGYLVYSKRLKSVLPRAAPRFATGAAHMTVLQALLGIGTLVYMVPIPLASLHQGGSVVVLSMLTCVLGVLRRAGRALEALARARDAAKHAARV